MLDVCDPRVIRALLEKYGFHFSKAKGQNFLTQRWVPQRIAQEAGIDRSTGVLEIGPGFGPLTQELCLRAGRVTAIELDTTLRPVLAEEIVATGQVIKAGRTLVITEAEVRDGNTGTLLAKMLGTMVPTQL